MSGKSETATCSKAAFHTAITPRSLLKHCIDIDLMATVGGHVRVEVPSLLPREDARDVIHFMELILRRIKRRSGIST